MLGNGRERKRSCIPGRTRHHTEASITVNSFHRWRHEGSRRTIPSIRYESDHTDEAVTENKTENQQELRGSLSYMLVLALAH